MCLALPAQVVAVDNDANMATVAIGEVRKQVSIALVDDVQVDEYLLIHVGYALNKLSAAEAERTLALFAEAGLTTETP
jgi:hydrogenase expression/formation protein HypC